MPPHPPYISPGLWAQLGPALGIQGPKHFGSPAVVIFRNNNRTTGVVPTLHQETPSLRRDCSELTERKLMPEEERDLRSTRVWQSWVHEQGR